MYKHNLFIKKLKKQFLLLNNTIENYFNQLKYFKSNYKKILLKKNNIVFLGSAIVVILTLSYLTLPTFYDEDIIKKYIKNQMSNKYNFDINFNNKLNYGLIPKPHFYSKNVSIYNNKKKIAEVKKFKTYIALDNFFSSDIKIKDLVFEKTDFEVNKNDLLFFMGLLNTQPNENKIIIKKSNIFFQNQNNETLFISKIYNSEFFYDFNKLVNSLSSKNEIFNVPFKLTIKNDKFNKKVNTEFKSKKIKLKIENEIDYEDEIKKGLIDILLVNKNTSLNFLLKKKSLSFNSKEKKNSYDGKMDFRPFYLSSNFNYEGLSLKNFFSDDSILFDLFRSEILNNENLNVHINFNVKKIININELNNLKLKIGIEQGDINLTNSTIGWKDDLDITLKDAVINIDKNNISVIGRTIIDIKDKDDFYSYFQIKKVNRKKIKKIEFDFMYNLVQRKINFENVKIDDVSSLKGNKFIDNFNAKNKFLNKILFKNIVNSFFSAHFG